jgi:quercetin 2,3-dioxygenase
MIEKISKSQQFRQSIFDYKFHTNKPVKYGAAAHVAPYSNIFYWSMGVATDDVEFGLHPHEGFEIFSFLIEGEIEHYDTETKVWTPLQSGDFQVIEANSGVYHSERIKKGSRAFQIWFDPNFQESMRKVAAYQDHKAEDFVPFFDENNIQTIQYIGREKGVSVATEGLNIKRIKFEGERTIALNPNSKYGFYLLDGTATINAIELQKDDVMMIAEETSISVSMATDSEFFIIETSLNLSYKTVWN